MSELVNRAAGDLVAAAMPSDASVLLRFNENLRWAKSHTSELRRHSGKYVVVSEGRIVFHSSVRAQAEAKAKKILGAYTTYVTPEQWAWIL